MDTDIAALTVDVMDQFMKALARLTTPFNLTAFQAPSFNYKREVELFLKRFDEVTHENGWTEMEAIVHLFF